MRPRVVVHLSGNRTQTLTGHQTGSPTLVVSGSLTEVQSYHQTSVPANAGGKGHKAPARQLLRGEARALNATPLPDDCLSLHSASAACDQQQQEAVAYILQLLWPQQLQNICYCLLLLMSSAGTFCRS